MALVVGLALAARAEIVGDTEAGYSENGSLVCFNADDGINGRELWRSDGSPEGTYRHADLQPGVGGSHRARGRTIFPCDDREQRP